MEGESEKVRENNVKDERERGRMRMYRVKDIE